MRGASAKQKWLRFEFARLAQLLHVPVVSSGDDVPSLASLMDEPEPEAPPTPREGMRMNAETERAREAEEDQRFDDELGAWMRGET